MARRKRKSSKRRHRRGRVARRGRRLRRNPRDGGADAILGGTSGSDIRAAMGRGHAAGSDIRAARGTGKKRRRRGTKLARGKGGRFKKRSGTARRALSKRLRRRAVSWRKRARTYPPRSIRRSTALTQAKRLSTLSRVARRGRVSKSPVYKAMHLKSNPGLAGLKVAAKVLVPQAGVAVGSLVACGWAGSKVSAQIMKSAPTLATGKLGAYIPAISTVGVTAGAYLLADKFAPKFKGAVALGGLVAAALKAILAAAGTGSTLALKAKSAIGLGSYADGGIFGEYTTIGDAYSTARPRPSRDNMPEWARHDVASRAALMDPRTRRPRGGEHDNRSEWALSGADDATEFAPGEGGILSGGIFK